MQEDRNWVVYYGPCKMSPMHGLTKLLKTWLYNRKVQQEYPQIPIKLYYLNINNALGPLHVYKDIIHRI